MKSFAKYSMFALLALGMAACEDKYYYGYYDKDYYDIDYYLNIRFGKARGREMVS